MSDDTDEDEDTASSPTDEEMADLLGVEYVPSVILPNGARVLAMEDSGRGPGASLADTLSKVQETEPMEWQTRKLATAAETARRKALPTHSAIGIPESALDARDTSVAPQIKSPAHEVVDEDIETQSQIIARLPKTWMRVYIAELLRCGSMAEAREMAGGVGASSVDAACRKHPDLARLHAEATAARHERVDTALYRGATEGDEVPLVSQGAVVSSYRKRDTKAAEVYYRRHGLLADTKATVTHQGHVTTPDSDLPAQLRKVAEMLFGGQEPKAIEGKVVSEPDTKDG